MSRASGRRTDCPRTCESATRLATGHCRAPATNRGEWAERVAGAQPCSACAQAKQRSRPCAPNAAASTSPGHATVGSCPRNRALRPNGGRGAGPAVRSPAVSLLSALGQNADQPAEPAASGDRGERGAEPPGNVGNSLCASARAVAECLKGPPRAASRR